MEVADPALGGRRSSPDEEWKNVARIRNANSVQQNLVVFVGPASIHSTKPNARKGKNCSSENLVRFLLNLRSSLFRFHLYLKATRIQIHKAPEYGSNTDPIRIQIRIHNADRL